MSSFWYCIFNNNMMSLLWFMSDEFYRNCCCCKSLRADHAAQRRIFVAFLLRIFLFLFLVRLARDAVFPFSLQPMITDRYISWFYYYYSRVCVFFFCLCELWFRVVRYNKHRYLHDIRTTVLSKRKFVFRLLDRITRSRDLNTTLDDMV